MFSRTDVKSTSCDDRGRAGVNYTTGDTEWNPTILYVQCLAGPDMCLAAMHDIAISRLQQLRPVSGHLYGVTVLFVVLVAGGVIR